MKQTLAVTIACIAALTFSAAAFTLDEEAVLLQKAGDATFNRQTPAKEPEPVEVPEVSEAQDEANEEVQEEIAEAAVQEEVDDFQETPDAKAADAFINKRKDEAEVAEALEDAQESPEAKAADEAIKRAMEGQAPDANSNAMLVGLAETEREKGILKEMVAKAKKKGMLQEADRAIQKARKHGGRDQHMAQHSVAGAMGINIVWAKNIDVGIGTIDLSFVFTALVDPKNCKATVHGAATVTATIKNVWPLTGSTVVPGTPLDLLAGQIPTVAVGGGAIVLMFTKGPGNAVVTLATDTGGCSFSSATVSISVCVGSGFCTPTQKIGTIAVR